jgi:hypothetical protein
MCDPCQPALHQTNPRVWLTDSPRALAKRAGRCSGRNELDRLAEIGLD